MTRRVVAGSAVAMAALAVIVVVAGMFMSGQSRVASSRLSAS